MKKKIQENQGIFNLISNQKRNTVRCEEDAQLLQSKAYAHNKKINTHLRNTNIRYKRTLKIK